MIQDWLRAQFHRARPARAIYAALSAIIFLFFAIFPACAAAPQNGNAHLDAVEVTGSSLFSSKQIVDAVGLRAGQTINRETLQQAADKLSGLGAFSTVRYHFDTGLTGVRVTYEVTDAPALPVTFDNFPWVSDEELSAALKSSVILFEGSAPASGSLVDSMDQALSKFLDSKGIHAQVTHRATPLPDKDGRAQEFHVEEAALTVQAVQFSDALANSDRRIQDRLPDLVGQPYSRSKIEIFEFEQVRPIYLTHAHLRVKFDTPVAKFSAPPSNPLSGAVTVIVQIEPGPAYQWAGVEWSGNASVSNADLDSVVQMQRGDLADGNQVQAVWERTLQKYQENGFLGVDLKPIPHFDDTAAHVSYAVTISEGPQYRMRNLVLTGLSVEGERRMRRAFPIPQDGLFDKTAYDIFIQKGMPAAFIGLPVHYEKIGKFLQLDPPNAKVDVLLDFQ
jgi:outer membrane protein insertion porin family